MKKPQQEHLCIGDIHFSIVHPSPSNFSFSNKTYQDFMVVGKPEGFILSVFHKPVDIDLNGMHHLFDSQTSWSLYQDDDKTVFVQKDPLVKNSEPFLTAVFDKSFQHGSVYRHIDEDDISSTDQSIPHPLDYPLGEILIINLLSQNRGVMFHACGVDNHGKGYLFCGNSTHGKSTMAELWQKHALVLNDDRIIVRKIKEDFWIYGTPWHGDHPGVSPKGTILDKIFFLKHGPENLIEKVDLIQAASMLLARSFPPIWDKRGMDFTLTFCSKLVSRIQCYKLVFRPDESVVDFLQKIMPKVPKI